MRGTAHTRSSASPTARVAPRPLHAAATIRQRDATAGEGTELPLIWGPITGVRSRWTTDVVLE